jgi:predicted amidohydrolase
MPRKRTYRIALAQLRVEAKDQRLNLCGILEALDLAAAEGADFLLAPEMALTGYHGRFDKALRDELMARLRAACAASGVTAIVGAGDKRGGRTYNEQVVIGGDGRILGRHAKMMLTSGDRRWSAPGQRLRVFRDRGLAFGCLICNDLWVTPGTGVLNDPRLTLRLARRGARVIFHSVYSGRDRRYIPFHESNLALRAREGRLFIAVANAAARPAVNCASGIVGPDGQWLIRCRRRGRQFAVADVQVSPPRQASSRRPGG